MWACVWPSAPLRILPPECISLETWMNNVRFTQWAPPHPGGGGGGGVDIRRARAQESRWSRPQQRCLLLRPGPASAGSHISRFGPVSVPDLKHFSPRFCYSAVPHASPQMGTAETHFHLAKQRVCWLIGPLGSRCGQRHRNVFSVIIHLNIMHFCPGPNSINCFLTCFLSGNW